MQQQISIAVEKIRDVTFEASLLANRHFLRCMEERGAVEPNCFNHIFFYTCMQFVCGKNKKCPRGLPESVHSDLDVTYAAYKQLRPDNLSLPDAGPLWHVLSTIAVNTEKDARNHMVANFARKAKEYIQILICDKLSNKDAKKMAAYIYGQQAGVTRLWPSSIEKTPALEKLVEDVGSKINFGPTPITDITLFNIPQEYMPFFYHVLRQFESRMEVVQTSENMTRPPIGWIKRKGTKLDEWIKLSKTKRKVLVACIRKSIENPVKKDFINQLSEPSQISRKTYQQDESKNSR